MRREPSVTAYDQRRVDNETSGRKANIATAMEQRLQVRSAAHRSGGADEDMPSRRRRHEHFAQRLAPGLPQALVATTSQMDTPIPVFAATSRMAPALDAQPLIAEAARCCPGSDALRNDLGSTSTPVARNVTVAA